MKLFLRILISIAAIVGIVFGGSLIKHSEELVLPEKYVYVSGSSAAYDYPWIRNTGAKYLGGDAYNYIVEASLKAGYYNAVSDEKAITKVGGLTLLFLSIFTFLASLCSVERCLSEDKKLGILQSIAVNARPADAFPTGAGAMDRPIDLAEVINNDTPEAVPGAKEAGAEQPETEEAFVGSDNASVNSILDDKVMNQLRNAAEYQKDSEIKPFLRVCSAGWTDAQKAWLSKLFTVPDDQLRAAVRHYLKDDTRHDHA